MTKFATTFLITAALLIATALLTACEKSDSGSPGAQAGASGPAETEDASTTESPAQAIEAIIALYQSRDFDTLIRTRYAEIDKAETEAQIVMLIERHSSRFAEDSPRDEAVATYQAALLVTPELTDDDTVATFNLDAGFIKLSRMSSGLWGFHL